jgi:hypothetical protein
MKKNVILPINDGHCGDTFRELAKLWEKHELVNIIRKNVSNCWLNDVNDILLYDKPQMQWFNPIRDKYNFALFGNPTPNLKKSSPWIFWGRRPELMEKVRKEGIKPLEERDIESIFLGKVENETQLKNRNNIEWSNFIELFEMPIRGNYKYTQEEYLNLLNRSKYGLCLAGFGNKCNREIELMSLGVVPIITPNVDLTYYNPLTEGVHYVKVKNPDEIKETLSKITDEKWKEMSDNCLKWYEENCSVKGSFDTTMEIINKYYNENNK